MTGRERVLATIAGRDPDSFPCMPITAMFAAELLGVRYGRYVGDHRIMADAQVLTAKFFGFDHVSVIGPAPESVDLGAKIQWFDDQPWALIEEAALFADKSVLAGAKVPASGRWMEDRVRGVELLRQRVGNELIVEGWIEGPCAEGAELRGINRLMVDFSDDPAFVHDLFEFTLELGIHFAAMQIAAGADFIGVGDAAASLVGPRMYKEQVWPWEKKLVEAIHALGGKVRLHICGNTRRILDGMGELGCDFVDIDYPVQMVAARSKMGSQQTLAGNLDPVRCVRNGSPEAIVESLHALQQQAGARWIVAAGCEIVRDTPHENLRAMVEFARTHAASLPAQRTE
jgi:MtaA/CmuA family methyltransferase